MLMAWRVNLLVLQYNGLDNQSPRGIILESPSPPGMIV